MSSSAQNGAGIEQLASRALMVGGAGLAACIVGALMNREQFFRSFEYAAIATLVAFLISYPLAYWIAFRGGRWKDLLLLLIIAPFFVLPFFLIPFGVWGGILTGNPTFLLALAATLILYGAYTVYLLVRRPEELARTENHPSWTHMYRMMMVAQVGFALAYLF